jgi:hypothetical protein
MGESSHCSSRVESQSFRSGFQSNRVESSEDIFAIFSFSVYFYKER